VVASKGKSWIYFVSFGSFALAILSLPLIKKFIINPYVAQYVSYTILLDGITFFIAWLALMFIIPEIVYFLIAQFMK